MSSYTMDFGRHVRLRKQAETLLESGSAPATQGWQMGVDALALLHDLASTTDSASSALRLLHELQVHQVELDLQQQQLQHDQAETNESSTYYEQLYDYAPVAYCTVGRNGRMREGNRACAALFGLHTSDLSGQELERFFSVDSRPLLRAILMPPPDPGAVASCEVQRLEAGGAPVLTRLIARQAPSGNAVLLMLIELGFATT